MWRLPHLRRFNVMNGCRYKERLAYQHDFYRQIRVTVHFLQAKSPIRCIRRMEEGPNPMNTNKQRERRYNMKDYDGDHCWTR
jgi:hypothetical protein